MKEIIDIAKHGVSLTINEHRTYHESVEEFMNPEFLEDTVDEKILREMIARDTIIKLQVHTGEHPKPLVVYHYEVYVALNEIGLRLKEHQKETMCY